MYYALPQKIGWVILLVSSAIFFVLSCNPWSAFYLLICIFVTYFCARGIIKNSLISEYKLDAFRNKRIVRFFNSSTFLLILGIAVDFAMLFYLKYLNFFIDNINVISEKIGNPVHLMKVTPITPIGVSFYTLISIGFLCDCYFGKVERDKGIFKTALLISFFPDLTSGPIIGYKQIGELEKNHQYSYQTVCFGLQRILLGVFKKLVLASRFQMLVDGIYSDINSYPGLYIWVAASLYVLQLYSDFSGCMDIVLGAAQCYGIILPENFRQPFFARSVQEFWQRWHISLGGWYREYILYPVLNTSLLKRVESIGKKKFGKRGGRLLSSAIGMLFVWVLFGLWHGGKWKYVAMGLFFWVTIVLENVLRVPFIKLWNWLDISVDNTGFKMLQHFRVFVFVAIGDMLFRLQNIHVALKVIKQGLLIFNPWVLFDGTILKAGNITGGEANLLVLGVVIMALISYLKEKEIDIQILISKQIFIIRASIWILLIMLCIIFGKYGPGSSSSEFIYQMF